LICLNGASGTFIGVQTYGVLSQLRYSMCSMEEAAHADDATMHGDELAARSTTDRALLPMVKPATRWLRGLLRAGKAQQRTATRLAKVLFGPVPATPRAKAVIVYHLAGYPADIRRIADICKERGLKLIEDCDNALLATVGGEQVGSFGDFAIYSFYPNRQINATEGGALCCRRAEDAERAIKLRRYGIDLSRFRDPQGEIDPNCDIPEVGWAATLNNLCSAIGYAQLGEVEGRIAQTRRVADRLTQELAQIRGVEVVLPQADAIPSYWAFLIKLRNRDQVMASLKQRGVQVSKLHQRTDQYSGFTASPSDLPNTKHLLDQVLGLPCGWWMSDEDIDRVVSMLRDSVEALDA